MSSTLHGTPHAGTTDAGTARTGTASEADGFGLDHLPYGVARLDGGRSRIVTRIGDRVAPVGELAGPVVPPSVWESTTLNPFLSLGPDAWAEVRAALRSRLADDDLVATLPRVDHVVSGLPVEVGDYVDFYSSIHHATNMGRILRPGSDPLPPNWRHLPVGYHGRSGTVVSSGTPVRRPRGLVSGPDGVVRRESAELDFELEVGFVVGVGNEAGRPIAVDDADRHVFGVVLVNDWSARDLQSFEYQPLGPFLGKSFQTSMSSWITPLAAVRGAVVPSPVQEPPPDAALRGVRPWGLDLDLEVELSGCPITRVGFADMYWTFAQQLAHLTSNGATVRAGDLLASGTVSGPGAGEHGSLIEATRRGAEPFRLADGSERTWLVDGDTVTIRGRARVTDDSGVSTTVELGEVSGAVLPTGG